MRCDCGQQLGVVRNLIRRFFRIREMRYLDFNSLLKQQMKVLEEHKVANPPGQPGLSRW